MHKSIYPYVFLIEDLNLLGGTEIQTINVANGLNSIGVPAIILSLNKYEGDCKYVVSFDNVELNTYRQVFESTKNKLLINKMSDAYLRKVLLNKLHEMGCKVLVNQTYDLVSALPFDSDIKIIQVFHWSLEGYEKTLIDAAKKKSLGVRKLSMWINDRRAKCRRKYLLKCDGVVLLTQSASVEFERALPSFDTNRISLIPNPLPYSVNAAQHSTLQNKNICFVGRLSVEKGCMRLLRIWEKVAAQLSEHTLSVYGDGACRGEMEEYIKVHNLQRVRLCGFECDLQKIYSNSDLLVSVSDSEGFGLVFIEAFYYGVPAVSFDCPVSPREVISDAGVLTPCFDEYTYANAVVELLRNADKMKELQNKAIDRAKCFYSNRIASEWEKLFVSIEQ